MSRALLLSAYHAASHARWTRGITCTLDEHDWTVLTLPPRHFRWRARGNPLWWALEEPKIRDRYDIVIATSTVDLSALLGLVPSLRSARVATYFHENQFEYPTRDGEIDIALAITDLYTALAADVVLFNSAFNRDTMLDGIDEVMGRLPDFAPVSARTRVADRSTVVPVGLEPSWFMSGKAGRSGPMRLVWNHRWEYDKAPERFFGALDQLDEMGVDFRVDVVGQQFRTVPEAFASGRERHAARIGAWGWVESVDEYRELLRRADVVVSTALHEFQGLAVLEAVASGCVASVPDRLAYREYVPEWCRYPSHLDDPAREARKMAKHLASIAARIDEIRAAPVIDLEKLRWQNLRDRYAALLQEPPK